MIKESHYYYYYTCTRPIPIFWHICVSIPTGFHGAHLCPTAGFQGERKAENGQKWGKREEGSSDYPSPPQIPAWMRQWSGRCRCMRGDVVLDINGRQRGRDIDASGWVTGRQIRLIPSADELRALWGGHTTVSAIDVRARGSVILLTDIFQPSNRHLPQKAAFP